MAGADQEPMRCEHMYAEASLQLRLQNKSYVTREVRLGRNGKQDPAGSV